MRSIRYLAGAEAELNAAADFYEAQAPGLGADFLDEIEGVEGYIKEQPALGAPYVAGTRRMLLRRFPFGIVYREQGIDLLEIIAVMHLHRRPSYWRSRLP